MSAGQRRPVPAHPAPAHHTQRSEAGQHSGEEGPQERVHPLEDSRLWHRQGAQQERARRVLRQLGLRDPDLHGPRSAEGKEVESK